MNAADQEAGNRAIDSLINYETVKVICSALFIRLVVANLTNFQMHLWNSCDTKQQHHQEL